LILLDVFKLSCEGVKVFVGGTIPKSDHEYLSQLGVAAVFTADMSLDEVVQELAVQLS
jgi:methylmalonyl-CoA mutase C-terminal domain/subunit